MKGSWAKVLSYGEVSGNQRQAFWEAQEKDSPEELDLLEFVDVGASQASDRKVVVFHHAATHQALEVVVEGVASSLA